MICGNFVIVDVDAQNDLEIAFQSFGNMPQTLSWFTTPLFVTAAYFKVGQMPVLQFQENLENPGYTNCSILCRHKILCCTKHSLS